MWLFFSENLALEALYNIFTQPNTSPFREAFLDHLIPDSREDLGEFSVKLNTDNDGKAASLEIHTERQVIFIETKFFGLAQKLIADRTKVLRKEYPLLDRRILCILTAMDRKAEVEEANKTNVATKYPIEIRSLRWSHILGVFAKLRREAERLSKDQKAAIESSQISVTRRRRTKS